MPSGNIESVVPAILPHFKVKMWSLTEQENYLDIKMHRIELKNKHHHSLTTPVPPHFLLLSPKATSYLREGPKCLLQLITQVQRKGDT